MEYADRKSGVAISRRTVLLLLGGALLFERAFARSGPRSGAGRSGCVVTPEQTEGPYFVDRHLNRSDIRTDPADGAARAGIPLALKLNISSLGSAGCVPLAGAMVDVWHCDAQGIYSGVSGMNGRVAAADKYFLRGYQLTDAHGDVIFSTIYPGWYPGRAPHIHFKVRSGTASGRNVEFTSQLYFDDAVSSRVYSQEPYANRTGRAPKNREDGLFRDGGRQLMLALTELGDGRGYAGSFDIALRVG